MVSLSLINQFNETVVSSSRPAILTYASPIISTSLTILNSPLLLAGFKKESETLFVEVMERFQFPNMRAARPRSAMIEIIPLGNRIQVYDAKLIMVAQFEGVRYFFGIDLLLTCKVGLCTRTDLSRSPYSHLSFSRHRLYLQVSLGFLYFYVLQIQLAETI
jgi:Putative adipose-regulatory protein (Seipin)